MIKKEDITSRFLNRFEVEWNAVLKKLRLTQKQLIIGSRLRPQIVLWGYLAGATWDDEIDISNAAYAAVSVELIHKASLLLDDWVDADIARHGETAFHVDYGEHVTVMTAFMLVTESIHRLISLPQDPSNNQLKMLLISLVVDTAQSMTNGALLELTLNQSTQFELDKIEKIATLETAEIIGNSFLIGYYLNKNTNSILESYLKKIGDLCGYVFQTMNDMEAFSSVTINEEHKGSANFDFEKYRKNIIIAYIYSLATNKEKLELKRADMAHVLKLFDKYKIKALIIRESELVFNEIRELIESCAKYGAPTNWVEGYLQFMNVMKDFATKRI